MRVFVTGATGFIGSAIVQELIAAGHSVLGLARSEASAGALAAAGAEVHRGTLEDPESLKRGAESADGVIHTAFIHDFSKFKENCEIDRTAIEAFGTVLLGSARPLIITSGTAMLTPGLLATEGSEYPADSPIPRVASEQAAASLAAKGLHVSVLRLPPSVHGDGDHGFVPALIALAREKGISVYPGEGVNVWPAVHRLDAARLYRLAFEKAGKGVRYHGVAEKGIPFRDIAEIIGRRLNLPVVSKSGQELTDHFGWFTHFAAINNPASSEQTRSVLGWQPVQKGLIADLEEGTYF